MHYIDEMMNTTKFLISCIIFFAVSFDQPMLKAQEMPSTQPSGQLFENLGDLKKNVDQLNIANQTLILKNEKTKASIKELEIAYQKLTQESVHLEEAQAKIQKANAPKVQERDQLNKVLADLKAQEANLNKQIKEAESQITVLKGQDEQLNQPNGEKDLENNQDTSIEVADKLQQRQKKKLALLKLISESEDRQVLLHEKFLDYQKAVPGAGVDRVSKKEFLEDQIKQLNEEIVQLNGVLNNTKSNWSEEQMHQLEQSVNRLEKNQEELKVLIKKMHQKAQKIAQPASKTNDQQKIEDNIQQFKKEAKNLRIDLEELQQQMIALDKRKAYLEALLQQ